MRTCDTYELMAGGQNELGPKLRSLRERQGISLRHIERETGINSGYLSQLERGEVSQPTPTMLNRIAEAYGVPADALLSWAGYGPAATELTPTQALALKHLGPDPSPEEVEAVRAVLDVLRKRAAGFHPQHHLDRPLATEEIELIRKYAMALVREADAVGTTPTPLDELMGVAKLVHAGEITLTLEEKRGLRQRLGSAFEWVMNSVEGLLSFRSREVWLSPQLHPNRRVFVHAHEIGHHILPMHRQLAYLDNWATMNAQLRDACEREANQAAIELLAQGDALRRVADDSPICRRVVEETAAGFGISLQATARRIGEESRQDCCVVIYFRGRATGKLMEPHVYASQTFEERFRWKQRGFPNQELKATLREAAIVHGPRFMCTADARDRSAELRCEAINTPRALIGIVVRDPGHGILRRAIPTLG